ncbi:MAG: hypothetical protein MUO78_09280 [candidate division Zixibacteria bacterium]|nr:hypothetical protein [candidate division Zixibacteria bacterium]
MLLKIFHTFPEIIQYLKEWLGWLWSFNLYIRQNFGLFAQVTFDLLLLYFFLLLLVKIFKATLNLVFYILIPSLILSGLTSFIIPYSFFNILPFFVCLLIGINLLKVLR